MLYCKKYMERIEASLLKDILANKKNALKAPPAYQWQDLALHVIKELGIPAFKKSSVFKVCRDLPKAAILRAMNDTKELTAGADQWKYFFKIIDNERQGVQSQKDSRTIIKTPQF